MDIIKVRCEHCLVTFALLATNPPSFLTERKTLSVKRLTLMA